MAYTREQFDAKLQAMGVPADKAATLRRAYYQEMVQPSIKALPMEKRGPIIDQWANKVQGVGGDPNNYGTAGDFARGLTQQALEDNLTPSLARAGATAIQGAPLPSVGDGNEDESYASAAGRTLGGLFDPMNLAAPLRGAGLVAQAPTAIGKGLALARGGAEGAAAFGAMGGANSLTNDYNAGQPLDFPKAGQATVEGAKLGGTIGALGGLGAAIPAGRLNPTLRAPGRGVPLEHNPLEPTAPVARKPLALPPGPAPVTPEQVGQAMDRNAYDYAMRRSGRDPNALEVGGVPEAAPVAREPLALPPGSRPEVTPEQVGQAMDANAMRYYGGNPDAIPMGGEVPGPAPQAFMRATGTSGERYKTPNEGVGVPTNPRPGLRGERPQGAPSLARMSPQEFATWLRDNPPTSSQPVDPYRALTIAPHLREHYLAHPGDFGEQVNAIDQSSVGRAWADAHHKAQAEDEARGVAERQGNWNVRQVNGGAPSEAEGTPNRVGDKGYVTFKSPLDVTPEQLRALHQTLEASGARMTFKTSSRPSTMAMRHDNLVLYGTRHEVEHALGVARHIFGDNVSHTALGRDDGHVSFNRAIADGIQQAWHGPGADPHAPARPQGGGSPLQHLLRSEEGSATAEGAAGALPNAAAATARGVGHVVGRADALVDRALKGAQDKLSQGAAGAVNAVSRRMGKGEVLRGGNEPTGEMALGNQAAHAYDRLREPLRHLFMGDKLGDDYAEMKTRAMVGGRHIAKEGELRAERLRQELTPDQLKELYRVLNDRTLTDTDLAHVSEPVRQRIQELSSEMHDLGSLSDHQFTANEGQYLKRLYEKHLQEMPAVRSILGRALAFLKGEKATDPAAPFGGASKRLAGSKFRGKKRDMSRDAYDAMAGRWEEVTSDGKTATLRNLDSGARRSVPAKVAGDYLGEWKILGERKNGNVTAWRDYTPAERTAMGESKDAALALEATFKQAAKEIRNGRLLRDVANSREMSVPVAEVKAGLVDKPEGWVEFDTNGNASGTPRWGKLAGHYVRPDVASDLQLVMRMQDEMKAWREIMAFWKKGKTVYSPTSHVNNFMQNAITLEMNGGHVQDLGEAARQIHGGGDLYKQVEELGLFENTYALTELSTSVLSAPANSPVGVMSHIINAGAKADRAVTNAYEAADDLFRMALVVGKVRDGVPVEAAVKLARTRMFHGDIHSKFVDAAANSVLPFIRPVAWTLAEVPKMAMRNPYKIAKLGLYWQLWNQAATYLSGQTNEQVAARQELLPDYQNGAGQVAQMPFRDSKGQPLILGTGNWLPQGNTTDLNEHGAIPFLPRFLNPGGPLNTAFEVASNRDTFRQRDIRDPSTSTRQQAADVAKYLVGGLLPSVLTTGGKVLDAAAGNPDYGGRRYDVPTAVANFLGLKVQPFDDATAYTKLKKQLVREIEDAHKVVSDAHREAVRTGDQAAFERVKTEQQAIIQDKLTAARERLTNAKPALDARQQMPAATPTFAPDSAAARYAPGAVQRGLAEHFDVNTPIQPRLSAVSAPPVKPLEPGNIDTAHRPIAHNGDGSISTVRSISIGTDDGTYLIPTVIDGKVVSNRQAIAHFQQTHEHLGRFKNDAQADRYAQWLHQEQEARYVQPTAAPTLARPRL